MPFSARASRKLNHAPLNQGALCVDVRVDLNKLTRMHERFVSSLKSMYLFVLYSKAGLCFRSWNVIFNYSAGHRLPFVDLLAYMSPSNSPLVK